MIHGNCRNSEIGAYEGGDISGCGRCGYGFNLPRGSTVVLASCKEALNGETLCLKCLGETLGDIKSATHKN